MSKVKIVYPGQIQLSSETIWGRTVFGQSAMTFEKIFPSQFVKLIGL